MKPLANNLVARIGMAGAIASAVLFAFSASAQDSRLSLADRVARLEQQAQNKDQAGVGMVNQMQQLQAQVRQLQGQIEELQHNLQQLDDKNKAQYTDLDSRLARLEGGGAQASGNAAAGAEMPAAAAANTATANAPASASSTTAASASAGTDNHQSGAAADPAAVQAVYDVAFKSLQAGNYVQASRDFRAFIKQYPDQSLTPNAWYWLGESYYVTTNYPVALESFQHLIKQFPQSEKLPDALLKVGYCQYELKQMDAAQATLTKVTTSYPGTRAASLAQERLRQIQLQANR